MTRLLEVLERGRQAAPSCITSIILHGSLGVEEMLSSSLALHLALAEDLFECGWLRLKEVLGWAFTLTILVC